MSITLQTGGELTVLGFGVIIYA